MHEGFDCDDVHLESKNLTKDSRSIVGSISMPIEPFASLKHCNIQWFKWGNRNYMGGFEGSTHPKSENMGPSP